MSTDLQTALSDGIASIAGAAPSVWTFGAQTFTGVASPIRANDPRMEGGTQRILDIHAVTANLPAPSPRRGDEIADATGAIYRVISQFGDVVSGITIISVTLP
jgi:hypothetical protein